MNMSNCCDYELTKSLPQMEKGDPEMKLLTSAEAPTKSLLAEGGITSGIWKKDAKAAI